MEPEGWLLGVNNIRNQSSIFLASLYLQIFRPKNVILCIYLNALQTSFITEANNMDTDQTTLKGAV